MNTERCVCCGDEIPEGVQLCRSCSRDIMREPFETREDCKHYNSNGYFCELTGIDCIGTKCVSYDNNRPYTGMETSQKL